MKTNLLNNEVLLSDSYKFTMHPQYQPGTTNVFSHILSRGSEISDVTVFFGLQYYLKKYLTKKVTMKDVEVARDFIAKHIPTMPFNYDGWKYIVKKHKGYLPLRIKAVKEGSIVPTGNVLTTVENTDDNASWLTTFKETMLLESVWYGSSVATISYECKKIIKKYLDISSDTPDADILFGLNDFGFRGVSSLESASIGGAAHLLNFIGTDNIPGILFLMEYYGADVCGYSIPAMEHSTVTSWTKDGEFAAFENMVNTYAKSGGLFACVIDSYDTIGAIKNHWVKGGLLDRVKSANARVVLRPDSGDPTKICVEVIELLMDEVGYTINDKGYKVLPNHVRVIQGDGVNLQSIEQILKNLHAKNISATNIVFGMGGALLQKVDRDSFKWAMKCSSVVTNGAEIDVYKDPITDAGKKSMKGRLTLIKENGAYKTIREEELGNRTEELHVVYENGKLYNEQSLDDIKQVLAE